METDIITAYAGANDALADSGIDVSLRVVHMERVRHIASCTGSIGIIEATYTRFSLESG